MLSSQAWEEAFQELWNHAAHHRGVREIGLEMPGHVLTRAVAQWPRTCGADVLAIASIVDAVLRTAPRLSGGHGIERVWRRCGHQIATTALGDPELEYGHNREFWSALASTVAHLASIDAPVPDSMWRALLAEVAAPPLPRRNTGISPTKVRLIGSTYDKLWVAQNATLAKLRGGDVRVLAPPLLPNRMTIPRTTNADVLQLATYWTAALAQAEVMRPQMPGYNPDVFDGHGIDGELRRWPEALAAVDAYAATGDPAALYPENEAFWRAAASVARTVAAIDGAPPPFEMLIDTTLQRVREPQPVSQHNYPRES